MKKHTDRWFLKKQWTNKVWLCCYRFIIHIKPHFSQYMALFVLYQCLLLDRLHIYEQFYLKGQPPFHLDVARKDLVITT